MKKEKRNTKTEENPSHLDALKSKMKQKDIENMVYEKILKKIKVNINKK